MIKDLDPEYIKNSSDSIIRNQTKSQKGKMAKKLMEEKKINIMTQKGNID